MPNNRRRRRSRPALPQRTIPFDFAGTCAAATKQISCSDLVLTRNRAMRPYKAVCRAVWQYSGYTPPAFFIALHDTKGDVLCVSKNTVVGSSPSSVSVYAPRGTDYGDFESDVSVVLFLNFPYYSAGTITYSGTIWMQFAPHKITSRVALSRMYPDCYPPDDDENELQIV